MQHLSLVSLKSNKTSDGKVKFKHYKVTPVYPNLDVSISEILVERVLERVLSTGGNFPKRHVTICAQNDRIYFFCNCNGYDMSKEKA